MRANLLVKAVLSISKKINYIRKLVKSKNSMKELQDGSYFVE